ncbi:exocyst complex component EXO70B1-like [Elaeis guineensis]|uniref:Exocyst subunit Exo70 family protein n=1 Tax=Elaeis guineensis var. tenera TaxID=51953 RepID=A0A6I9Q8G0_ELAGV|nr:exocyst complex component EXO70B1-like [Elaeis guineensis]XP_029116852.1 exocyst complex component EXO70B1-like [Elaeis guineensis]XP_029116853.1 exocyst complex component EXO70B1-like [Elaeis guineensis]
MAAAAKIDGQEKVIAAAQHIVKSLATSKNAAEDMIRILSGFDNRLSIMNDGLFPPAPDAASGDEPSEAETRLEAAEKLLLRWDTSSCDSLLWEAPPEEIAEFVAAADEVISLVADPQTFPSSAAGGDLLCRAESALQIAMSRLEEEFRYLMIQNTVPLNADGLYGSIRRVSLSFTSDSGENIEDFESSVEEEQQQQQPQQQEGSPEHRAGSSLLDDRSVDLIRPEAISCLKEIADRMIWADYGRELHQVYCTVRRDILDECLSILGVDRMSIEEVQRMEWRMLDDKMKKWIQAVKIVVRVLLTEEKRLCDQIFAACEALREECFTETAKGCVMQLLNFGDAIAICQRSSEKLFRILDMYEALADVMPDLQALFSADSRELICGEAEGILKRLGDAVRGTLLEFENAVQRETSRKPMQGGEIHPLTRYVMNYMRLLVVYGDTLDLLLDDGGMGDFSDKDRSERGESDDSRYLGSMTPLGRRLLVLMSYLESNVEEKSKLYEDGAMQYIFLMNNILYIVQKVKDSELGRLLGDRWIRNHRSQIRQCATCYLRTSWTKVLSCLKDDGFGSGSGSSNSVSKMALKERFKSFNLAFEEIYRVQTTWKVPDPQLREELRISISEKVIPAYRSFMGRFGGQLEGGRNAAKYIKYTPEDLENHLLDLFEGLPGPANHPRRKS